MSSVLGSVEWGKHALDIIKHTKELDPSLPAIMHIRHSERFPVNLQQEGTTLALTSRGEKTAYEFGTKLPANRQYFLHYTHVNRTQQTAENIQKGIHHNNGTSYIGGIIPATTMVDREAYNTIMANTIFSYDTELEGTRTYIHRWLSGFYPPSVMKPSIEHAKDLAAYMMMNLKDAGSSDFHIYVSHDMWVASLFLHWLGEVSFDFVQYMDGFILQFYEEYVMAYFRGTKMKLEYPYWWSF